MPLLRLIYKLLGIYDLDFPNHIFENYQIIYHVLYSITPQCLNVLINQNIDCST